MDKAEALVLCDMIRTGNYIVSDVQKLRELVDKMVGGSFYAKVRLEGPADRGDKQLTYQFQAEDLCATEHWMQTTRFADWARRLITGELADDMLGFIERTSGVVHEQPHPLAEFVAALDGFYGPDNKYTHAARDSGGSWYLYGEAPTWQEAARYWSASDSGCWEVPVEWKDRLSEYFGDTDDQDTLFTIADYRGS